MLAQDANFRLKSRLRSLEVSDVCLGDGKAYFVNETRYKEYLKHARDEEVVSPVLDFVDLWLLILYRWPVFL